MTDDTKTQHKPSYMLMLRLVSLESSLASYIN